MGRLYDKGLGHRLFGFGVTGFGLACLAVSFPSTVFLLVVVAFTLGIMGSAIDVGGNALLLWHGGVGVTRNMNILHLMFGFGAFAAPVLVDWSVSSTGGLTVGFIPVVVLGAIVGLSVFFGPVAPSATTGDAGAKGSVPTVVQLAVVALFFFVYVGAEVGFGGWVFTYAEDTGSNAAVVTAGFWGAFTLCRLLVAVIGHRVKPAHVLFTSVSIAAAGAAMLLLANHSGPLVFVGVALVGAGVAPQFPTMLLFAERRVHLTGQSMSVFLAAAGLGAASIPWLMGQVIDSRGTDVLPTLGLTEMILVMACTVLVAFVLPAPRANR